MSDSQYSVPLIHNTVSIMTPFLLAAIGGLFTELAGMLNIALEGLMLIGAFFGVLFTSLTGDLFTGILLGVAASMLASAMFGYISLFLRANVFITGLATNLFASGLTVVLSFELFGNKGVIQFQNIPRLPVLSLPASIQRIPIVGDVLFGHSVLVYISWIIVAIAALVIYRTPLGLRIRGTGLGPQTIVSLGLSPRKYQMIAILMSGFTCGIAGSVLTLGLAAFVPGITSGRGWIALVAIYLGNKNPFGILVASFVFGLAESFSNYAQGTIEVPADFILAFPYIITVVAMIAYSAWKHYRTGQA